MKSKTANCMVGTVLLTFLLIYFASSQAAADPLDLWYTRSSGISDNLNGIIYANNIFVAVGDNGKILSSSDGITWIPRTSQTTNKLNGISYQNGLFFALGDAGTLLTSSGGITWQLQTLPSTNLYDIIYANQTYVLVGWDYIMTSPNLIAWSTSPIQHPAAYTIAYGDGLFVHSGETGEIYTSSNGMNWTYSGGNTCYIGKILFVPDNFAQYKDFFAVGCIATPSFSSIGYVSNTGLSWSAIGDLQTPNIIYSDITYGNNTLVAVGSYGSIKTSTDMSSWTTRSTGDSSSWSYKIAYGNDSFVIVGDSGLILQSDKMSCANPYFKIGSSMLSQTSIELAYGALQDDETLQIRGVDFNENAVLGQNKSIILQGGYDCDFTTQLGSTTINNGSLTITGGLVSIDKLIIK